MQKRKGFTLIEMVIVMFIISLLLLLIVPNLAQQKQKAEEKSKEAFIEVVQNQVDLEDDPQKIINVADLKESLTATQKEKFDKYHLKIKNGIVEK
ncbi:competence type IV pilus major pilin ComGC [Companilactobacillus versmoldensis]|uniref:Pilin-like component of the DNA transport membrane platform n=1 Tax=Companilactobacillus versmoldensis DSM 14857 = KCTC 3814 TaxID=1423815 RepID=A0A0R1SR43_9LACO|nr:competence type IV pilus major pilin ComGC [Companilactobacillus versmoldensis]KRL67627.1 pilin-like component of the DNA transport membrane platform [Companilactobacillus versmoldensis DSM 14857 = KCTC 3814]